MGQEASVPHRNGADEFPASTVPHQAPPQGGRTGNPSFGPGGIGARAGLAAIGGRDGGRVHGMAPHQRSQQPQPDQQSYPLQPEPNTTQHASRRPGMGGLSPQSSHADAQMPNQHLQYQQHQQSQPQPQGSSTSLMSRAGLTSMIQRMGSGRGVPTVGGVSGHLSSQSARRFVNRSTHTVRSPANQNQNNQHHTQRDQQHQFPSRAAGNISSTNDGLAEDASSSGPNAYSHNGGHYPLHYSETAHQDLSPMSQAQQQSMMRQQEQHHLPEQTSAAPPHGPFSEATTARSPPPPETLVDVIYSEGHGRPTQPLHTNGSRFLAAQTNVENNAFTTNVANNSGRNVGTAANTRQNDQNIHTATLVHGMANLVLREPPSSPRPQPLKEIVGTDEDDWENAWEQDDESDEDDEDEAPESDKSRIVPGGGLAGGPKFGAMPSSTGRLGNEAPSVPLLKDTLIGTATLPPRPGIDSGHSSSSVQVAGPSEFGLIAGAGGGGLTPHHLPVINTPAQGTSQKITSSPSVSIAQHSGVRDSRQFNAPHTMTLQEQQEDSRLVERADQVLQGDGTQWDLSAPFSSAISREEATERPCVDMFNPMLRVLGRGSFGRVVLVQKQYGHGRGGLFAMKILRKSHLVRRRQIERTKTERKVLAILDHPFIMKLHYAFQTTEKLFLVLDYCPGGELFFHLSRYRRFQEPVARFYTAELLLAVGHLHKNGIIYRDLKPENVLLDAEGHVKLGDFGLAKGGIRHPTQGAKSMCGTPEYMAPEVLNQSGHGFCVDYWGLGMILFEMMTGLPPWYTTDRSKLFRRLRSAPLVFPNEIHFSPQSRACITGLLERDPRLRIGVLGLRSVIRHDFFYRRINFEALRARKTCAPIRPCEGWRQFQRRSSSVVNDSEAFSGGWHSAGPSLESAALGNITAEALDVATANFDDTFRRMPVETEDYQVEQQASAPPISEGELNDKTFSGFTFDGDVKAPELSGFSSECSRQYPSSRGTAEGREIT